MIKKKLNTKPANLSTATITKSTFQHNVANKIVTTSTRPTKVFTKPMQKKGTLPKPHKPVINCEFTVQPIFRSCAYVPHRYSSKLGIMVNTFGSGDEMAKWKHCMKIEGGKKDAQRPLLTS